MIYLGIDIAKLSHFVVDFSSAVEIIVVLFLVSNDYLNVFLLVIEKEYR